MRTPTTSAAALQWHIQAMNNKALYQPVEAEFETPHAGWFMTRVARGGPFVPARIWIEQEVCPETGELLSDEIFKCEINGKEADPCESWTWLHNQPITEEYFKYLVARAEYAGTWAPSEPAANPFQKVDWGKVPTPTFTKEISP